MNYERQQPTGSCCYIFLEDETSEKQTDGILKKLNLLNKRLRRLREGVEEMFPDKIHMIPSDNNIDISKMGYGGAITTAGVTLLGKSGVF